jgi:hypothetical protein
VAERVTNVDTVRGPGISQVRRLLARFGGGALEVRGNPRDSQAMFQILAASRGRLPVRRVTSHTCQHDEDVPTCTVDQEG